jgi:Amt family ammonium transporter
VVVSVVALDRIKIDDPVGAISVHLTCGIWGTLAVGLLGAKAGGAQLWSQIVGVVAYGVFAFVFALAAFLIIKSFLGLRVSAEEESKGLDLGEHGLEAYPDFEGVSERLS